MWMQYSIGFFRLGRINPVDEGLPSYALLAFILAFIDKSQFANYHIFGTVGEEFIICLVPLLMAQLFMMGKFILKKAVRPRNEVLSVLWLYFSTALSLISIFIIDNKIYEKAFYEIYYMMLFMWARNMILIQLYFITKQKYKVFNRGTNLFLFALISYMVFGHFIPCEASTYFLIFCILQALVFMEFVVAVLKEGC